LDFKEVDGKSGELWVRKENPIDAKDGFFDLN